MENGGLPSQIEGHGKLPPYEWGEQADIDAWKAKIDQEDVLTSQWLKGKTAV